MKFKMRDVEDLLFACHEIIGDFHDFGTVLQADDNGEYGEHSGLGRLIKAVKKIEGGKR